MWQAKAVRERLIRSGVDVEFVPITTEGDRIAAPLRDLGGRGVFTKALQHALLEHEIDLAVHSLKDLATETVAGIELVAVLERGPMADVLISRTGEGLDAFPRGARVGTGSPRRAAQLLWLRPDLTIVGLRGNVGTRLDKLVSDDLDGIVLAEAGLVRLGLADRIAQRFSFDEMLPAAGQGAIGIECRVEDRETRTAVERLDHGPTRACITAERTVLATLEAGCLAPVGIVALPQGNDRLTVDAAVLTPSGDRRIAAHAAGPLDRARFLGEALAAELLDEGAATLIAATREH